MREILDNARYAPTVGRYKVYLIDEVHMLSKAAFNSMLKTLEEPPEHVKFVLATTDPQKIPVTVLSRCLQFNLKPLPPAAIEARLAHILGEEGVAFDASALALIARAAQGSLRDALSLLDQAIAFGSGEVREAVVRSMLGAVDRDHVYRIVDALIARDGPALVAEGGALAQRGLAFGAALEELASLLHRVAVAQVVPAAAEAFHDAQRVRGYAEALPPDAVQLAYQICVQGRADLALAPDEAAGFAMTLLRLLAFEPVTAQGGDLSPARETRPATPAPPRGAATLRSASPDPSVANVAALRAPPAREAARPAAPPPPPEGERLALPDDPSQWPATVAALKLSGMAAQLAAQNGVGIADGNALTLALPVSHKHLADRMYADKLKAALEGATGRKLLLAFEVGEAAPGSLAAQERRAREDERIKGEQTFRNEPFVRDLLAGFGAKIKPETIKPLASGDETAG
jgi:DNA polymerase-3 subunit gamma/tau